MAVKTAPERNGPWFTTQLQVVGARLLVGACAKQTSPWLCQMEGGVRQPTGQSMKLFPGAQTRESLGMPPPTLTQPQPSIGGDQKGLWSSSTRQAGQG